MNPAEDFWLMKVARRHFSMDKVDLVEIVEMVDNMVMVVNVNMVDGNYIVNMQKTFSFLKWLLDTSGRRRQTW